MGQVRQTLVALLAEIWHYFPFDQSDLVLAISSRPLLRKLSSAACSHLVSMFIFRFKLRDFR